MNKMHIILTGHLHDPSPSFLRNAAGKALVVGAGASYETRETYNSFDIIDVNPKTGRGQVRFYKYLPLHNKWKLNTDIDPFPFTLELNPKGKTTQGQ